MFDVIGVDPGLTGGISWISKTGEVKAIPLPSLKSGRYSLLDSQKVDSFLGELQDPSSLRVAIEDVHSFPSDSRKASFTFGCLVGSVVSYFLSKGLPLDFVTPAVWQAATLDQELKSLESRDDLTRRQKLKQASVSHLKKVLPPPFSLLASTRSKKDHEGMADAINLGMYYQECRALS